MIDLMEIAKEWVTDFVAPRLQPEACERAS